MINAVEAISGVGVGLRESLISTAKTESEYSSRYGIRGQASLLGPLIAGRWDVACALRELLRSRSMSDGEFRRGGSQGELARLAGVDRHHLLRFLDHTRTCPSLSFVVPTLEARIAR
jgi:hypothetical protein